MSTVRFIEAGLLTTGMKIASKYDKLTLRVITSYPVAKIETRRGCNGIHVNGRECWDSLVPVAG